MFYVFPLKAFKTHYKINDYEEHFPFFSLECFMTFLPIFEINIW